MTASTDLAAASSKYSHIEPVHVQASPIIGADPYNAEMPILRARPVNEDGTPIRKAVPVGPDEGVPAEEPVIKLKPPPPLKIGF